MTCPHEALSLRARGAFWGARRVLHDGVAGSWNMNLRGWGRPLRPTASDPSLASGGISREGSGPGQAALLPKGRIVSEALEDQPTGASHHNPGSREIGNRRRAGGEQHSPEGWPWMGWEQAASWSSVQSSRPETTARAGLGTQCSRGRDAGILGSRPCQAAPTRGQRPPRREFPGGLPGPHGPQRWTHLFQFTSLGKTRPRRMVQSSVGS